MPPAKGSAWSDKEKIALLVSIIRSTTKTTPNWKVVALPEGRTLGTSQKIYGHLVKDSEDIKMVTGSAIPPPTPTPKKNKKSKKLSMDNETDDEGAASADSEPLLATPTTRSGGRGKATSVNTLSRHARITPSDDDSVDDATPVLSKKRGKQAMDDEENEYSPEQKPAKKAKKAQGTTRDESVRVVIGRRS